jgi:hypothetical protein
MMMMMMILILNDQRSSEFPNSIYCEGEGVWVSSGNNNNNNNRPWGGKGTLPYTPACTVNSSPGPGRHLTSGREEEKGACSLARAGLSTTYIGYVSRVSTCLC